ncbi:HAEPLYID family protein [Pontibacter harenae]|uniref:HAEPLYID family protein n=1 Tax=Pontibacter harenae TaxID=2894083 RepID=UPI001E46F871|nr:HAEPLYID family protein [Pontibacter harenae]MCC9167235.1 phosphoribosylformylglycinamidine synthase [Pontibacter harenae]
MRYLLLSILLFIAVVSVQAQDTLSVENAKKKPLKIEHAEPLYIDLIRDLGAHKGEKEWNIGAGMTDNLSYDEYEFLVEYEWAPINRLGLEIEVPVTLYSKNSKDRNGEVNRPSDRVESLKLASQYTFFVSEKLQTSMALGQITEFEFKDFDTFSRNDMFQGLLFNPFFIAAKRWGKDFHSLIYTGPRLSRHFGHSGINTSYEVNTSFHYMIPHSRNFVGLELNKEIADGNMHVTARPQMRLAIHEGLMVGIVSGIPLTRGNERISSFVRLIYEPGHKRHSH